jgi:hypothetical protein
MICSPNSLTTPNPSPPQKKHTHTHNNNNNSFSSRSSSSSASRSSRFAHLNLANKTRIKPQTTMMIMMILMRLVVAIVVRILDSCCDWSERPKVRGHKSSCIPIGCEEISRLLADDSQAKSALWRQWESVLSYIPPKMDDWLNEWMNGWMDESMNEWSWAWTRVLGLIWEPKNERTKKQAHSFTHWLKNLSAFGPNSSRPNRLFGQVSGKAYF